ncbi:glycosyl hydrolase family 61-domain-containing protein [Xylariales sp. AK1849]|nr:glycosyl hydrolase family 61-domain-containing protein [Xylariales sp. AK1849]
MRSLTAIVLILIGATTVSTHSFVTNVIIDLKSYAGFWPILGSVNDPIIVGWNTTAADQGWLGLSSYTSPDIICHRNGTNARGYAAVAAGDKVYIQWRGWPEGHKSPVIDYLASCGEEGCQSIDKTELEFFKINQRGLINALVQQPCGEWATDQLIANNNSWLVEIPPAIKPGFYVLRTEILALHNATSGVQHYPQCLNLEITGNGTEIPVGVLGKNLYNATQPGLKEGLNITTGVTSYAVPGPTLIPDAVSVELSEVVATGTGLVITATEPVTSGSAATMAVVNATKTAIAGAKRTAAGSLFARTTKDARSEQRRWYHQGLGF